MLMGVTKTFQLYYLLKMKPLNSVSLCMVVFIIIKIIIIKSPHLRSSKCYTCLVGNGMVLCLADVQTHPQDDVNTMFILLNIGEEMRCKGFPNLVSNNKFALFERHICAMNLCNWFHEIHFFVY